MKYKRLEIYTGWKCNHKCVFCIEYHNMEKAWEKIVTKEEIMKKLIKYRKEEYNHVTFLGGEPFIHPVFGFAIQFARKLGYTVLVTTNASTLQFESQALKYLPYIDELLISLPTIDPEKQQIINRTKGIIDFAKVFDNIKKHWHGTYLKINTVINQLNLDEVNNIIDAVGTYKVTEMSITYPDVIMPYYSKEHIKELVAPSYTKVAEYIESWFANAKKNGVNLILTDIPFCTLPHIKYSKYTDDYIYQTRLKIDHTENEIDRNTDLPRRRNQIKNCRGCTYVDICWGPSRHYEELYTLSEIHAIIHDNNI